MRYDWWSPSELRYNGYALLTSEEVYKHFEDTLRAYNHLEEKYLQNYSDPEILSECQEFSQEDFRFSNIDALFNKWISKFRDLGYVLSYRNIKPLIHKLKFKERRHLIVETPKGFIQFKAAHFRATMESPFFHAISYEILPKLEVK